MVDRLINWGSDATDARYQTRDSDPAGGDFVVVNDTTGGGQLLIWDYSAGEWAYGGPVNMGGNDITNAGTVSATALEAETIANDYHYAGSYDGADQETRLENAIAAASAGETIYLEDDAFYGDPVTISKSLHFVGTGGFPDATTINDTWTLDASRITVENVRIESSGEITGSSNSFAPNLHNIQAGTITISSDKAHLSRIYKGDITFQSGTSSGLIDSSVNVNVIDNGTNTVGDIT